MLSSWRWDVQASGGGGDDPTGQGSKRRGRGQAGSPRLERGREVGGHGTAQRRKDVIYLISPLHHGKDRGEKQPRGSSSRGDAVRGRDAPSVVAKVSREIKLG